MAPFHYRVLVTVALVGVATPSFARGGGRDSLTPPTHSTQFGGPPSTAHARPAPAVRGSFGQPPMSGTYRNGMVEHRLASGHRVFETTQSLPGRGTLHAVRYGTALTGVVERPMLKSGYSSRTYVQGGRIQYARVYRRNTFQRFGHAFAYESLVPAIGFNTAYYAWAVHPWSTPVSYRWQWDREPWHRAYGNEFTPYSNYTSLDEWLTDYVVAQNYRNAYESWQAENASANQPAANEVAPPDADPGQRPYWDTPDDGRRPYWEEQPAGAAPSDGQNSTPGKAAPVQVRSSKTGAGANKTASANTSASQRASAGDSAPPLSDQMKAQLNAQIKRQLVERQTPAATPEAQGLPHSLAPGHTLFRVSTPLDVPLKASGQLCSLRASDYIERTGDMDQDGMVPVQVKVGGASDCPIGLVTKVSVNDLEAMESEQQQALTDALIAASKNMGSNRGLPQAPSTTPLLLAAGQTRPTPDAPQTLGQLQ
jgi:hypothetical protein